MKIELIVEALTAGQVSELEGENDISDQRQPPREMKGKQAKQFSFD